jgi:hypothetical protein
MLATVSISKVRWTRRELSMHKTAAEILESACKTHKEKGEEYGNTYLMHGEIMKALFPNGLNLESAEDFTRFGTLNMIISKLGRYTSNVKRGNTHIDSLHDIIVYAAMLEEIDRKMLDEIEQMEKEL